jgi:DNA integrity scanning protein DisA with diadenylate cyclase activity
MTKRLIQLIDGDGDNIALFACDYNSTTEDQITVALEECSELDDFESKEALAILQPLGIERVFIDLEVRV